MKITQNENYIHWERIEFNKEVCLLDKFQCEYLLYFYGVCFILNKTYRVTEFSQFESLQNLMKKKRNIKIMNVYENKIIDWCIKRNWIFT